MVNLLWVVHLPLLLGAPASTRSGWEPDCAFTGSSIPGSSSIQSCAPDCSDRLVRLSEPPHAGCPRCDRDCVFDFARLDSPAPDPYHS